MKVKRVYDAKYKMPSSRALTTEQMAQKGIVVH